MSPGIPTIMPAQGSDFINLEAVDCISFVLTVSNGVAIIASLSVMAIPVLCAPQSNDINLAMVAR